MGIVLNALVIGLGCLLGSMMRRGVSKDNFRTLGISIVIVSLVGFFENIYNVDGKSLMSEDLILVLIAFMLGSKIGELLKLEEWFSNLGKSRNADSNAVLDAFLYFGIGGMQICGPIALAAQGDNSQLILKSIIDIPFALVFGATYGKAAALSAIPVALVQVVIWAVALVCGPFFTDTIISQLCAMGFVILFFSGFNLVTDSKHKIDNLNMLPSVFLILIFGGIKEWLL